MNLSPHFYLTEATFSSTAARLGIDNTPTPDIIQNMVQQALGMEKVRAVLGFPIHVDSWFRCKLLNTADHGAPNSAHLLGWATDFICRAFGTPLEIAKAIVAAGIKFDKLIMEGNWVHISFAPELRGIVLTAHFVPGKATTYTDGLPKEKGA